jgi:hypothetical protein
MQPINLRKRINLFGNLPAEEQEEADDCKRYGGEHVNQGMLLDEHGGAAD